MVTFKGYKTTGMAVTARANDLLKMIAKRVQMGYKDQFAMEIQRQLPKYFRWLIEGKPRNGYSKGEQTYYDPYHYNIDLDLKIMRGTFHFQTHDSPMGDDWESGEFVIVDGFVEVIDQDEKRTDVKGC